MSLESSNALQGGVIGRRFFAGALTCIGVTILYLLQLVIVFLVPAIGARLVHALIYYPWVDSILYVIPLIVTFVVALYAPQGRSLIFEVVGLRLVSRSAGAAPSVRQRILRWVLLVVTAGLVGLPLLAMLVRSDRRAIHDVLSGTDVIRKVE